MAKTLLKVAGGINIAFGACLFLLFIPSTTLFSGLIGFLSAIVLFFAFIKLALGGTFLVVSAQPDEIYSKYRPLVLAGSVISFFIGDLVTFVLSLIAYLNIKVPTSNNDNFVSIEETREKRKMNWLLGLGCGLVLLSGVIFATSNWETLSGVGKTISLLIAAIILFGVSYLAEDKLKLKTSGITYYILGNAFLIVSLISAGYFNLFGEWFSLNGEGINFYMASMWGIFSLLLYFSYLRYGKLELFYLIEGSLLFLVSYLLMAFNLGIDVVLLAVIAILSVFSVLPKNNELLNITSNIGIFLLPVLAYMLFVRVFLGGNNAVFSVLSFAIVFCDIYYLALIRRNMFYKVFAPIYSLITLFVLSDKLMEDSFVSLIQCTLFTSIIYFIGFYKRNEKIFFNTTTAVCDLGFFYLLLNSIDLGYNYLGVILGILLIVTSILVNISKRFSEFHFEKIIEPIKIIILSSAVYTLVEDSAFVNQSVFAATTALIFSVMSIFRKKIISNIYFVGATIISIISVISTTDFFYPITHILNVITLGILIILSVTRKDEIMSNLKETIYIGLLTSIAAMIYNAFENFDMTILGIVILTFAYLIIMILSKKDYVLRSIATMALLVPYTMILRFSNFAFIIDEMLQSLILLFMLFVYTRGFLRTARKEVIKWIEIAVLTIWYLMLIFSDTAIEVAVFVGIVSFISILIGYKFEKFSSLYYTGIGALILNTVVQLKEFWTSIPIWAYILVAGLTLLGVVAYKEYSKSTAKGKESKSIQRVEAEIVETPFNNVPDAILDTRAIIVGSILVWIMFIFVI